MPSKKAPVSAYIVDDYSEEEARIKEGQEKPSELQHAQTIESLYNWYRGMSEVRGVVNKIVTDVFSEGYSLDGAEARVKKTKSMLSRNQFQINSKAVLTDTMITGDGYMGVSMLSRNSAMKYVNTAYESVLHKSADTLTVSRILEKAQAAKPDIFNPRGIFPLSSRSMYIDYNSHGVIEGYVLRPWKSNDRVVSNSTNINDESTVGAGTPNSGSNSLGEAIRFDPDEVLHFSVGKVGDSVYGSSPLLTAINDVGALFYAKRYGAKFFQNDATPSRMYLLRNESPTSQNYKNFCNTLSKHWRNPHKSMVVTGDVDAKDINPLNKDLEFSNFIDKFTQRLLMAYQATERFTHLFTGKPETPQQLEGYYKLINTIQSDWEEVLNSGFFERLDIDFSFNRTYKRDESREADIVSKLVGLTMTQNEGREYTGYKPMEGEEYNKIIPRKVDNGKSEVGAADARSDQNANNPSAPGRSSEDGDVDE